MNQAHIFTPMLALMVLTLIVWVYMYAKRIPFIQTNKLTPDQLDPREFAKLQPPAVSNPSDNLKNLFELPVLFYALALYLHATSEVDTFHLVLAWGFVGFRYLHSAMHCTRNVVLIRFGLYASSAAFLWIMLGRALLGLI